VGSQQVGLQGNAVTVTTGHLEDRLDAVVQQDATHGQAAHSHHRSAPIGDIHGVNKSLEG
jgi:hypothetical protein